MPLPWPPLVLTRLNAPPCPVPQSRVSPSPPVPRVANAGFEGLAFSPSEGSYYLTQQKEPQAVYRLLPDGTHTVGPGLGWKVVALVQRVRR